jgi:hypothetical protein
VVSKNKNDDSQDIELLDAKCAKTTLHHKYVFKLYLYVEIRYWLYIVKNTWAPSGYARSYFYYSCCGDIIKIVETLLLFVISILKKKIL